jgi:hypothetical protein
MGEEFWDRVKFRAEGVMQNFDASPSYIQDHIREFNTSKGAIEPAPGLKSALDDIRAVVGWSADAAGVRDWKVDIDIARDFVILIINGVVIDLFPHTEIDDMTYRNTCAGRVRRALENFKRHPS